MTVLSDALYQSAVASSLIIIPDSAKMLLWHGCLVLTLVNTALCDLVIVDITMCVPFFYVPWAVESSPLLA